MAKRARGSVRPGQRRRIERRAAPNTLSGAGPAPNSLSASTAVPRAAGLTDAEAQRAAELEAQLVDQERVATKERTRTRERAAREVTNGGTLAVRAEEEYAYVARDVRRIVRTGSLMLAILFGLWFVIDVMKVFPIN
jgi:hypothetical protein